MIRRLLALCALALATPITAQVVTVNAPLPDKSGDGHVTVSSMAAQLGVAKSTVLTRCGQTLTYVGPKSTCSAVYPPLPDAPRSDLPAAPIVTTAPHNFGPSAQIAYVPAGASGNVHATRCMDCLLLQASDGQPRTISDVVIDQSRTGLTTQTKKGPYPATGPWTLQRFSFASSKRGIYIRGGSHDIVIRDGVIRGIGVNTSHGDIPVGIGINGGRAITIERVEVSGFQSDDGTSYPNADGISCERVDSDITVRDAYLHDNTDGGFDCKATNVTLDRVTSARNRYGFRLWVSGHAGTLTADSNRVAAVEIMKDTAWTIDRLVLVGPAGSHGDIEVNQPGGQLTIGSCSRPVSVHGKGGNVTLGANCK